MRSTGDCDPVPIADDLNVSQGWFAATSGAKTGHAQAGKMTLGFGNPDRIRRLEVELKQWELYQVNIDLYYVEFWFQNGHALANVAYRFETRSPAGETHVYDVQADGNRKTFSVDYLLRRKVLTVEAATDTELLIGFEGGGWLTIHDSPTMRSAWFYRYAADDHRIVEWAVDDEEHDF